MTTSCIKSTPAQYPIPTTLYPTPTSHFQLRSLSLHSKSSRMSLILGIETSTTVCSVALTSDGATVATEKLYLEKSHSSLLTIAISDLLKHAGVDRQELSAVAVSKGPGSYTGLRIGVSTAKGICYALDKPLIAINTLKAMAHEVNRFNTGYALLCPMIDARRMEVYTALFNSELRELNTTQALILDEDSFTETIAQNQVFFFGNGAAKFQPLVESKPNAVFIEGISPSAEAVAQLAQESFEQQDLEDVAYFEPYYLKDFIATVPKKRL